MRVLSVIIGSPLRKVSGATNAGLALSAATAERPGVEMEVALMWDSTHVERDGRLTKRYLKSRSLLGPLGRLVPRGMRVPLYDSRIPQLVRGGDYDVVHLHNLIPTFAALRVARAARRRGIPYVISTHGFVEIDRYAEINGFGFIRSLLIHLVMTVPFRRVVRGAARILALSDREYDLLHRLGVSDERIDVVTNGVDEFFLQDPTENESAEVRANFVQHGGPVVLFMGSLHAYKGVGTFLRAFALLHADAQAVVAGRFNDPGEPARLLDEAGISEEIRSRVTFTGGISNQQLRALYRAADVFVYPTSGDTLPLVVLEAMASGLPIVSTRVGGIPYEVTDDCGVLVDPGDAAAVAEATDTFLRSPEGRREVGRAARARVTEMFRWHRAAAAAVAVYERLAEQ